jgi:hypothetical protein
MSEDSQIVIPESFLDLYRSPGRAKLQATQAVVLARYELCEDVASALVEQANTRMWELGVEKTDIVSRIRQSLMGGETGLSDAEAEWVSLRLSELMDSH